MKIKDSFYFIVFGILAGSTYLVSITPEPKSFFDCNHNFSNRRLCQLQREPFRLSQLDRNKKKAFEIIFNSDPKVSESLRSQLIKSHLPEWNASIKSFGVYHYLNYLSAGSWSGQETLERFLTIANFGNEVFGISKAAWYYFGKSANQLSFTEISFLKHSINNPELALSYLKSKTIPRDLAVKIRSDLEGLGPNFPELAPKLIEQIKSLSLN